MRTKKTEAFALRSYPLRENDKIVNLFTKDYGKIRGVARGARKLKNRFGASFEPFTQLELEFYEKESRELVNINNATVVRSPYKFLSLLDLSWHLAYMGEVVDTIAPEREPDPVFFRLLQRIYDAIEGKGDIASLTRYFEIWTLKLHGVLPEIKKCSQCHAVLKESGAFYLNETKGFYCPSCAGALKNRDLQELKEDELDFFSAVLTRPPLEVGKAGFGPATIRRVMQLTSVLVREFAGKEIRSFRFIEELARLS